MCKFAVQTVVCGHTTGNVSDPISITFYALEQPPQPTSPLDNPTSHNLDTPYSSEPPAPTTNYSSTDNPWSYNLDPTENMSLYTTEKQGIDNLDSTATETVGMHSSDTDTRYKTSIGLLATALMVCVVIFIIVISIILIRSKAKLEAALQQSVSPGETIHEEPMYEDITGPMPSESAINTQDNVAYGHGHTQTTTAR